MIQLPHLETNLTAACQNRCASCNHFVPLQARDFRSTFADPEIFERDLYHFGRVAKATIWSAIGGEPLLHPALCAFLEIARESEAIGQVEVRTNGQALLEQPERFWKLVDLLVVTPYPGKLEAAERIRISELAQEHFVRLEWHAPAFVRLLEPATSAAKSAAKFASCWFRTFSRVLDRGWFYRCCTAPYIPKLLLGLPEGTDGLRVDERLTAGALERYLAQTETPASCSVCCGIATASSKAVSWHEVSDPKAWLEASGFTP